MDEVQPKVQRRKDTWVAIAVVPSDRDAYVTYEVTYRHDTGEFTCTCPAFKYKAGNVSLHCKHIRRNDFALQHAVEQHLSYLVDEPVTDETPQRLFIKLSDGARGGGETNVPSDDNGRQFVQYLIDSLQPGHSLTVTRGL